MCSMCRESAQRSRVRKVNYVSSLENENRLLKMQNHALREEVRACMRGGPIPNRFAANLMDETSQLFDDVFQ